MGAEATSNPDIEGLSYEEAREQLVGEIGRASCRERV